MEKSNASELKVKILLAIRAQAEKLGIGPGEQGPGRGTFIAASGFSEYDLTKCGWVNWSDALVEAGYKINTLQAAIPLDILLEKLADLTRKLGRLPTNNHLRVASKSIAEFPTLTTFSMRIGSQSDRHRLLTEWCASRQEYADVLAILSLTPSAEKKLKYLHNDAITSNSEEILSDSFVPPIIASLPVLAMGSDSIVEQCRALHKSHSSEFERRVGVAFRVLGFQVQELGQGKGAVADGIAKCVERQWAVIYDAKVRGGGYRLLTEDRRKFRDYISVHEKTLSNEGIRRIYFAVVSSEFSEHDLERAREVKRGTDARSCVLIEASALVALVERRIRDPIRHQMDGMERIFEDTRILAESALGL